MSPLVMKAKIVGRRGPVFEPIEFSPDDDCTTVRGLLASIVRQQVRQFAERQESQRLVRILTEQEIERGLAAGRISSGGSDLQQSVDVEAAVEAAWTSFRDGFFYFFLDDEQLTDLDQAVDVTQSREALFLRLVPLVGG
jgi:hypothetical protein